MEQKDNDTISEKRQHNVFSIRDIPEDPTWAFIVSVWRCCNSIPLSDIQKRADLDQGDYPKIEMSSNMAKVAFVRAVSRYLESDVTRDVIEDSRRHGEIVISSSEVLTRQDTFRNVGGYLVDDKVQEVSIRQIGDIVSAYTIWDRKTHQFINTMDKEKCKKTRIPYLDLVRIRNVLGCKEDKYSIVRKVIYHRLSNKNDDRLWFEVLQEITMQPSMQYYRKSAPMDMVKWYLEKRPNARGPFFLLDDVKMSAYNYSVEDTWKFALDSDSVRGTFRGRGVISSGYYDHEYSTENSVIREARDIIGVLRARSLSILRLMVADRSLAVYLAYNGIMVVCAGLSKKICNVLKPGVVGHTSIECPVYTPLGKKPHHQGPQVVFGVERAYYPHEIRSTYLSSHLIYSKLYASCRVAEGVAMSYYEEKSMARPTRDDVANFIEERNRLVYRFSRGIVARNTFLINRRPFYLDDELEYRSYTIKIPGYDVRAADGTYFQHRIGYEYSDFVEYERDGCVGYRVGDDVCYNGRNEDVVDDCQNLLTSQEVSLMSDGED